MNKGKSVFATAILSSVISLSYANEFIAIIGIEDTIAQKVGAIEKNITEWKNVGLEYNCTSWSPNPNLIDYGESFTQSQDCSQNQSRTKDIYTVYNTGEEIYEKTLTENKTIIITNLQIAIGTKNYVVSTSSSTGSWTNNGGVYNCSSWSPAVSTVNSGTRFTQTRTCKQNQDQTVTTYNNWADGSQTVNSTSSNSRTVNVDQTQTATGTKPIGGTWVRTTSWQTVCGPFGGSPIIGTEDILGQSCSNLGASGYISKRGSCTMWATARCQ